jgi:hypothetical protein
MSKVEETKKLTQFKFGREMELQPKDGELSTKTIWVMKHTKLRDLTLNSVSESNSSSIFDPDSQCKE